MIISKDPSPDINLQQLASEDSSHQKFIQTLRQSQIRDKDTIYTCIRETLLYDTD